MIYLVTISYKIFMAHGGRGGLGPRGFLTEEEKKNKPNISKELIIRILSYLKPYKMQFFFVLIAIILSSIIGLLPSVITGRIVDEALIGENLDLLLRLLLMAFATLTASQAIGVIQSYINYWISNRIIFDMKNQMYEHLQQLSHEFYTTERQGDIITRMENDINGVGTVISNTLTTSVSNLAVVIATLFALFSMSWRMALVGIAVIPLLILPTRSAGRTRFKFLTESQIQRDKLNQILTETMSVSGSMLMKLFTREAREYQRFVDVNKKVSELSLKEQNSGRWFLMAMGMFTQLGPLLIYFAGGWLIITNKDPMLTVGTITAMVALVNRMYRPVESLLRLGVEFTRSLALFTRIFDYYDKEISIKNKDNPVKIEIDNARICFNHVGFSYKGGERILQDINIEIPSGKMYAIVGPSGAGKSTLANLIPRIFDVDKGSIEVNGIDIRDYDLTFLRQNIGVVSQEAYLFNGTIKENILYAKYDATDEEIERACKMANIHDFITNQSNGYDTEVGNRGLKLSGGEKQRISLARVVLKNPKILILDEATSSLDSISENAIQDALEEMMKGRTSIVIAHRLSTILTADRILVIKDGVIKEQGSHKDLLKMNGVYKELYETQFRRAIGFDGVKELLIPENKK